MFKLTIDQVEAPKYRQVERCSDTNFHLDHDAKGKQTFPPLFPHLLIHSLKPLLS